MFFKARDKGYCLHGLPWCPLVQVLTKADPG